MDKELKHYLDKHGVQYVLHAHEATMRVSDALANKKVQSIPGMRCKTLFMKDEHGQFYLIALPGTKQLNTRAAREHLGVRTLAFASPEELKENIGVTPGNVSIFGALKAEQCILILDSDVWSAEHVQFHPNINTETLELTHEALERYYESLKNKKHILDL